MQSTQATPAPEAPKPKYLVNPVLDSAEGSTISQLRIGRSSLRTDLRIDPQAAPSAPSLAATRAMLEQRELDARGGRLIDRLSNNMASLGSVL